MSATTRLGSLGLLLGMAGALLRCSSDATTDEPAASTRAPLSIGGCTCPTSGGCSSLTYSDIPADGIYYITTFGGGADTQPMACGGTADGTWAYVADSARFGCNTKVLIEANGKSCVAKVSDCGPNRCVEEAACYCSCGGHFPLLDSSPFITQYLFGASGMGWSDKQKVTVSVVDSSTAIGCPGGPVSKPDAGAGGSAGSGGSATGGAGGTGGAGATGGSSSGGTGGVAGAVASGGQAGSSGNAGTSNAGTSGSAGTKSGSAGDVQGGCACELGARGSTPSGWLLALGAAAAWAAGRRRRH